MSDILVKTDNLSKKFCRNLKRSMFYGALDVGKSMVGLKCKTDLLRKDEFWALQNVNMELRKGETLGIIGINGSGKSTLLRLITGIFPPDKGRIEVNGRISSLIAVGAGFHPHMTGKENIYLNGIILGMKKKEIDEKLEDIIAFSELEHFMEAPVATYSSGMTVRLGFAIAMFCKPDILLVDEVLSVGDMSFRSKSLKKMAEYRKSANGIVFISHNLDQVRLLCSRVMILNKGVMIYNGDTAEGCAEYEDITREKRFVSITKPLGNGVVGTLDSDRSENVYIGSMEILNENQEVVDSINSRENFIIKGKIVVKSHVEKLYFTIAIMDENWTVNIIRSVSEDRVKLENVEAGNYELKIGIKDHKLAPGLYYSHLSVRNAQTTELYDRVRNSKPFKVNREKNVPAGRGVVEVDESWGFEKLSDIKL